MKKAFCILLVLVMFSLVACGDMGGVGGGQSGKYQWVLVDVKDHEAEQFTYTFTPYSYTYTFTDTPDYSRCNYMIKMVYDGESREDGNVRFVHGETYSARCIFSEPPETIGVGEKITLDLLVKEEVNSLVGWLCRARAEAKFLDPDRILNSTNTEDIILVDEDEKDEVKRYWFEIGTEEGISVIDRKISAITPGGKKGARVALRVQFSLDYTTIGTDYIYELQKK